MFRQAYRNTAIATNQHQRTTNDGMSIVFKYDWERDVRTPDVQSRTEYVAKDGEWVMTRRWEEGKGITFKSKNGVGIAKLAPIQLRKLPIDLCKRCYLPIGKCYC